MVLASKFTTFAHRKLYYSNHLIRRAYSRSGVALGLRDLHRITAKICQGYAKVFSRNCKYVTYMVELGGDVLYAVWKKAEKRVVTFVRRNNLTQVEELKADATKYYNCSLSKSDIKQLSNLVAQGSLRPCGKRNATYQVGQVKYNDVDFLIEYNKKRGSVTSILPPEMKCRR